MNLFAPTAAVRRASRKRAFSWRGGAAARFLTGLTVAAAVAVPQAAHAQWLATPVNNVFGTSTNWTGGLVNGNFTGPSTITTLSVANGQQIPTGGNLVFSGATTPSYTLGLTPNAGSFATFSGASVQMLAGVTANQTINSGYYQFGGTAANKANVITASAVGQTLTFNGDYNNVNGSGTYSAGLSNYLNLGGTGGNGVWNGIISNGKDAAGAAVLGNVIVKKLGTANYTLNGANTYTGGTEMGNGATGTLTLGNKSALGTGIIRVISGTGGTGSGFVAGTTLTGVNAIANSFNYVGNTATAVASTFSAPTSGSNQVTITVAGTATPAVGDVISGNLLGYFPNYTRVTAVSGSGVGAVITLSNAASLTAGAVQTGNTAAYNNSGVGTSTISGTNDIEFSGTQNLTSTESNLTAGTQTFNITNTGNTIFSGVLQQLGGVASVAKTGAGTLIFTAANTYTGTTAVNGGILQLGNGGTTGSLNTTGAVSVGTGATLVINRSNTVTQGTDFSGAAISGAGALTQAGTGTTILTAANAYTGTTTINSGSTLQIGNGGSTGSLANGSAIVDNGSLVFNRTGFYGQSNLVSGTGSVLMTAALGTATGTLTFNNAASSYTGTTTIQNGTLDVGANSLGVSTNGPLGNAASAIILGNAGTQASSSGGGFAPNASLQVSGANGAGLTTNFTISRDIDSSATANVGGRNDIQLAGFAGATNKLTVSGNWSLGNTATRAYGASAQQAGQTVDFTGAITGGNAASTFRINDYGFGTGTVRMSNTANTYAMQTTVTKGTLLVGGDALAGSGVLGTNANLNLGEGGNAASDNAALTDGAFTVGKTIALRDGLTTTSTFTLGGTQAVASSFTGNVNTAATANSRTLNLSQVAGGTVTFSGVIGANANVTGTTSIATTGAGTVVLSGANTYDGTTSVNAGTLAVNGSTPVGSAVTVASGATLTGTGTAAGAVTDNGTINAGSVGTVGTLTTGAETYNAGSGIVFDFGNNAVDALVSTGVVSSLSGVNFVFNSIGDGTLSNPSYTLIAAGSFADNILPTSVTGTPAGYSLQYDNNTLNLVQIAAAPEPSQWLALGLGALGVGVLALKARRRTALDTQVA